LAVIGKLTASRHRLKAVMPGHGRSKNGVASLAYVPGIRVFFGLRRKQVVDGRNKSGHDGTGAATLPGWSEA